MSTETKDYINWGKLVDRELPIWAFKKLIINFNFVSFRKNLTKWYENFLVISSNSYISTQK